MGKGGVGANARLAGLRERPAAVGKVKVGAQASNPVRRPHDLRGSHAGRGDAVTPDAFRSGCVWIAVT